MNTAAEEDGGGFISKRGQPPSNQATNHNNKFVGHCLQVQLNKQGRNGASSSTRAILFLPFATIFFVEIL
jgi:hypothetical protein